MDCKHDRLPCPSPTPRACSNSCPSSLWCHPTISSSIIPFSSCLQSFPTSGSFPMSQFFASGGQSIGVSASASVLPMNNHNTVYISQDMEATYMSISRWMDKTAVVHIHNGTLLSHQKEYIWISSNEDETGSYYTEWSKPERKTPLHYTNAYIWNLERW